jgi:lipoprotein-releasing system permease protein
MLVGLLVATHIPQFFSLLESIVNALLVPVNFFARIFMGHVDSGGSFALFSPAIFYLKEIPSRVIPHEAVMIFLFGFLSAVLSAWFASKKTALIKPAEVLRYE